MAEASSHPDISPSSGQPHRALKSIYFISGLGADERVFSRLKVDGYHPVHIRWLAPHPGEALADYASRLKAQILDPEPILVGLSFGGLVAMELAQQLPTQQVVLISSAKHAGEIPIYFKLLRFLPLHRVVPFKRLLGAGGGLMHWLFSLENQAERRLLQAILRDTDPTFLKWALHRVVVWRGQQVPEPLVHLHGRCDRIFPRRWVDADVEIEGGHLMVFNRAATVSQQIQRALSH